MSLSMVLFMKGMHNNAAILFSRICVYRTELFKLTAAATAKYNL